MELPVLSINHKSPVARHKTSRLFRVIRSKPSVGVMLMKFFFWEEEGCSERVAVQIHYTLSIQVGVTFYSPQYFTATGFYAGWK